MSKIYQLLYLSQSSETFSMFRLDELLQKSRLNNKTLNITGLLIYNAGFFLQFLEGDKSNVQMLYKKIQNDSRHGKVKILYEQKEDKRIFNEWDMAYKNVYDFNPQLSSLITNFIFAKSKKSTLTKKEDIKELFNAIIKEF
jgi:hypothetical protein